MNARLLAAITELTEALAEAARLEAERPAAPDRLLSIPETAATLSLSRSVVYGEIGAGRLRTVKVGRRRLVPAASITEYIAGRAA